MCGTLAIEELLLLHIKIKKRTLKILGLLKGIDSYEYEQI